MFKKLRLQSIERIPMISKTEVKFQHQESQFKIEQSQQKKRQSCLSKNQRYSIITYDKRVQLIKLASTKGYSISRAARQLGIKASTGKFIVKCYRDTGKIMKKSKNPDGNQCSNEEELNDLEIGPPKVEKTKNIPQRDSPQEPINQQKNSQNPPTQSIPQMPQMQQPLYYFVYPYEQPSITLNQYFIIQNCQNSKCMHQPFCFQQQNPTQN